MSTFYGNEEINNVKCVIYILYKSVKSFLTFIVNFWVFCWPAYLQNFKLIER